MTDSYNVKLSLKFTIEVIHNNRNQCVGKKFILFAT